MKRILLSMAFLALAFHGFSQTKGISYQAVLLNPESQEIPGVDAQGNILANSAVSLQFTILNESGTEEYQEYHKTNTDRFGMVNLLIGTGTPTTSNNFDEVSWNGTVKKLKVGIDFSGGRNFSLLSEQDLTYIPQPANQETLDFMVDNMIAIEEETARASTAENTLAIDLAAETNRATVAESVLQGNMATMQEKVDTNKTTADTAIALKEDSANKSTDVTLADNTDTKFPTEKAVKTYVDGKIATLDTSSGTVQTELNDTQAGAGLGADGSFTANTTSNFLTTATSLKDSDDKLDVQIKTNATDISTNVTNIALKENSANKSTDGTLADGTDTKFPTEKAVKTYVDGEVATINTATGAIQTELDATQTGSGLGTDGSYTANAETNFLKTATSLKNASEKLDTQVKTNATDIATNATNIALKENSSNKSTDVTLSDATDTKFPTEKAVKTYVDGKEIDLTTKAAGILPIANGGTGATTATAAFNALSPMTTAGDLIYGGTSGVATRLGAGTNGQVLTLAGGLPAWTTAAATGVTGTGTAGSLPYWSTSTGLTGNPNFTWDNTTKIAKIGPGVDHIHVDYQNVPNMSTAPVFSVIGNEASITEQTLLRLKRVHRQGNSYATLADFVMSGKSDATKLDLRLNNVAYNNYISVMTLTNSGKVGIGNTGPTEILDVAGNVKFSGAIMPNNLPGTSGQVLTSAGAGAAPTWTTPSVASSSNFVDLTTNQTIGGVKTFNTNTTFTSSVTGGNSTTSTLSGFAANMNTQIGTAYTLTAADNGKIITLNNASAITLTVPALFAGFNCMIVQLGAGQVTLTTGTGVTISNRSSYTKTAGTNAIVTLIGLSSTGFISAGDML